MSRSLISSSKNPPIQIGNFRELDELKTCGCAKSANEQTSWKYHNPGKRFWNYSNSLTSLKICDYFLWKDDELREGYYKNLNRTLKQQVDSKEKFVELINLIKKVVELEFMLSKEKSVVDKLEKNVTKEKQVVMMLNNKLEASMQQNFMLKVLVVIIMLIVALWCFK
ncbi:unnamed protein product [Lactuca saligna]|uniref:Zinc finger GRF-type domain-containing protein n=1 Tax=Lactuca saligna TaxID=75948 RepID=A0AA35VVG9_LACSI|nr:unnamed protein product [Lactuca saligna]